MVFFLRLNQLNWLDFSPVLDISAVSVVSMSNFQAMFGDTGIDVLCGSEQGNGWFHSGDFYDHVTPSED